MFSALELRSLLGLVFLYATRMLGLFMVLPVLALHAPDYAGATALTIGLSLGIYGLSQGLLQIPFGLASDHWGRKRMIALGIALFVAGSAVAASADDVYWLMLGRALQGAGAVSGVIMALLADLTREQVRTRAMAAVGGSIGLSFAVAMALGPLIAAHWGMAAVFWVTAALGALGLPVLLAIPTPAAAAGRELAPVPELLGRVLRDRELLRLDLGIFALHFAQMATWVSVPVLLEQVVGFPREQHWYLYLGTMAGGFVLMIPFVWYGETRRRLKPVFVGAIALLLVAELVIAQAGASFTVLVAGLLLFFMAFNLLEATLPSLVSKLAPAGIKGTALGVYSTSQFLGAFAGGAAGGLAAQQFGWSGVFWLAAGAALVWLLAASSMQPPRRLRSLVVDTSARPLRHDELVGVVRGVEGVIHIPSRGLTYIQVDDDLLDSGHLERLLGQPLGS
ncbi:MAG TPA: MFS transporter [Porticoccaceae bacterium]|nr:MFS transporter [Porticoccaceae bacterium]